MPVDAARRIRTARLRGESEPLIGRGARLLEDALRTASLAGPDRERVLLIRSLSLGVLRPEKSPVLVARQLERRVAECARHAVHGGDPRAADAPAVFFHDRLDAVVVLIQRLAQGSSGDGGRAWFWRAAIPGWQPGATPVQAGRLLLGSLLNLETGPQALSQAFQRLIASRSLDVILQAVREEDGLVLLRRCGWGGSDGAVESVPGPSPAARVVPFPVAGQAVLFHWVRQWGLSDDRSLWLVAMAVQSRRPEHTSRSVLGGAKAVLRTIAGSIDVPVARPSPDDQPLEIIGEAGAGGASDPPRPVDCPASGQQQGTAVYTPFAGFWLLIPLLVRAGFGRAIQDHPEWVDAQVPRRLLRSFADRLAIPPDDAVSLWLSDDSEPGFEPVDHQPDAMMVEKEVDAVVAHWRTAMRRWCRLRAGLGPVNLVRRPGRVSWSQTHVDVRMPLSEIDLRIRRTGLDLDPGWVFWLGQVVRFHYDAERRPYGAGGSDGA